MNKTAQGLVDYCRAQLGKPYWWGTFGQIATAELLDTKREQSPGYYTASDFLEQLGQRVHDCVGLIKGYRWSDTPDSPPTYVADQDVAVGGLFDQCSSRGDIGTMPDKPGLCVFRADLGHVGVYIGGGQVIEAMGHAQGVVLTALDRCRWAFWGAPAWIDYNGAAASPAQNIASKPDTSVKYNVQLPLLKRGSVGGYVRTAQLLMISAGISCGPDGADGEYGANTVAAVTKFQQLHNLLDDGEIGGDTWSVLLKG